MNRVTFQPPQKVTIVESIVRQVLAQIRENALKPGDKLPSERQLIGMFGVSRSSVREALQGLVAMDVVEIRAGQGIFVKHTSPMTLLDRGNGDASAALRKKMWLDLMEIRLIIDEAAANLAAERASEAELQTIAERVEAYEHHISEMNLDELARAHDQMHLSIAQATNNSFLVRVTEMLLATLPTSLRISEFMKEAEVGDDAHVHQAIYEAIKSGKRDQVKSAIRQHMEYFRSSVDVTD